MRVSFLSALHASLEDSAGKIVLLKDKCEKGRLHVLYNNANSKSYSFQMFVPRLASTIDSYSYGEALLKKRFLSELEKQNSCPSPALTWGCFYDLNVFYI